MSSGVALSALPGDAETPSGTHPHMHTRKRKNSWWTLAAWKWNSASLRPQNTMCRHLHVWMKVCSPFLCCLNTSHYCVIPLFTPCKISVAQNICLIFQYLTLLCSTFMFFWCSEDYFPSRNHVKQMAEIARKHLSSFLEGQTEIRVCQRVNMVLLGPGSRLLLEYWFRQKMDWPGTETLCRILFHSWEF